MSSNIEENKELVRRFFAAIEGADFQVFDEIVAKNYDDHLAGQRPGAKLSNSISAALTRPFPISSCRFPRCGGGRQGGCSELCPWDAQRRFRRPSTDRSQDRRDGGSALPHR